MLNFTKNKVMDAVERRIVASYSGLLEGLSSFSKMELIAHLSKSLKTEEKSNDAAFYQSFGAFASEKPAEEIIRDIKESRKFRNEEIQF